MANMKEVENNINTVSLPTLTEAEQNFASATLQFSDFVHDYASADEIWTSTLGDNQNVATCGVTRNKLVRDKQHPMSGCGVAPLINDAAAAHASVVADQLTGKTYLQIDNQTVYCPQTRVTDTKILKVLNREVNDGHDYNEWRVAHKVGDIALPKSFTVPTRRLQKNLAAVYHIDGKNYVQTAPEQWYLMEPVAVSVNKQGQIQCPPMYTESLSDRISSRDLACEVLPEKQVDKYYHKKRYDARDKSIADLLDFEGDAYGKVYYKLEMKKKLPEFTIDFDANQTRTVQYLNKDFLQDLRGTTFLNEIESILQKNQERLKAHQKTSQNIQDMVQNETQQRTMVVNQERER